MPDHVTLREECRLSVFENRVLRRIFGPKRDEVTGEWRRLHNKELYALYSSSNITGIISQKRQRWAGYVTLVRERRGAYRVLVGKPEGRRSLGRTSVDGRIILNGSSRRRMGMQGLDRSGLG
jgi:hypothetical protein